MVCWRMTRATGGQTVFINVAKDVPTLLTEATRFGVFAFLNLHC